MVPLCSVFQVLSYKPRVNLLTPFSTKLSYLSRLFILELACSASIIVRVQASCSKNHAAKLNSAHMIVLGTVNTIPPLLLQYPNYWWNKVIFLSTAIRLDRVHIFLIYVSDKYNKQPGLAKSAYSKRGPGFCRFLFYLGLCQPSTAFQFLHLISTPVNYSFSDAFMMEETLFYCIDMSD